MTLNGYDYTGKTVLVTGGNRGLGLAMTEGFASAGARLVVLARDAAKLEEVAVRVAQLGSEAVTVQCDLADANKIGIAVNSVYEQVGAVDVLINNAGMLLLEPFLTADLTQTTQTVATNVTGFLEISRLVAARMATVERGNIINIGSIAAIKGRKLEVAYSASKGAVAAATRSMALELAGYGIRVNTISPGLFLTDINREVLAEDDVLQRLLRRIPMRRTGDPTEVFHLAAYLASDHAGFVTGQDFVIDGGATIL